MHAYIYWLKKLRLGWNLCFLNGHPLLYVYTSLSMHMFKDDGTDQKHQTNLAEISPRAALTPDFEKRSHHRPWNQDGGLKPEVSKKRNGRRHVGCRSSIWRNARAAVEKSRSNNITRHENRQQSTRVGTVIASKFHQCGVGRAQGTWHNHMH